MRTLKRFAATVAILTVTTLALEAQTWRVEVRRDSANNIIKVGPDVGSAFAGHSWASDSDGSILSDHSWSTSYVSATVSSSN